MLLLLPFMVTACATSPQEKPLVFASENTATQYPAPAMPDSFCDLTHNPLLPDPFEFADGSRSTNYADWEHHRSEIMHRLMHYELGQKPQTPRDSIEAVLDADTLRVTVYERGETLVLTSVLHRPEGDGPFPAIIGIGMPTGSLPDSLFRIRGIARMAFNFPQVMAHTQVRGQQPINRLYPELQDMGSYIAWAWGVSRLIDGLEIVGEASRIDLSHLAISGCSFAGKMALFAGAFDERIALTIAQEPGGGGVDAWRVSETLGNVETIERTNYSWFLESMKRFEKENVGYLPVDHHQVAALIAPRALLVFGNTDYEWLADESNYVACQAARHVWRTFGIEDRMGFSINGGHFHCFLPPTQYPELEAFLDRFLLQNDTIDTNVAKAPMFADVDYKKWMPWAEME